MHWNIEQWRRAGVKINTELKLCKCVPIGLPQSQMIISTCAGILPPRVQPKDFTLDVKTKNSDFVEFSFIEKVLNVKYEAVHRLRPNTLPINGTKFTIWTLNIYFHHRLRSDRWRNATERRSVYSHQSCLRAEVFNDQTFLQSAPSVPTGSGGLTWNPKLKSYVPALWPLGHVFVFQLRLGSGSLPVCTGVLSATLSAVTDSKRGVPPRRRPKASIFQTAAVWLIWGKCDLKSLRCSQPPQKTMLLVFFLNYTQELKISPKWALWCILGDGGEEAFQEVLVALDALLSRCDKRVSCFLIALHLIDHVSQEQLITPRRERVICPFNTQSKPETSDGGKLGPKEPPSENVSTVSEFTVPAAILTTSQDLHSADSTSFQIFILFSSI